jgi:N-methylhydantoinase A
MGFRIGIDVGGTFTDFLVVASDGTLSLSKNFTTPDDQSAGVMEGLERIAMERDLSLHRLLARTDLIIHGATVADNTMIEMNGAKTGLLVTKGARDEIELRRGWKEDIWDPAAPPPPVIVPRRFRLPLSERLDNEGNELMPLDEEEVRAAVRRLKGAGIQSLAVVLLFSFINPANEKHVAEIIREEYPEVGMISLSHEIHPAAPEFERTSTTVVNAYVGPRVQGYLRRLADQLAANGFRHELLVMQSSGGIATVTSAIRRPIATLASGPAGGVMGACLVADESGVSDFISVDMGGTSYDVCLVRGGEPTIKSFWNWVHRYLIALPMVDVMSIGSGGGSVARVRAGGLSVGPESAGSDPGPVCYGRGGTEPTVTDANLVLGYLNPEYFAGGEFPLKADGIAELIEERIGEPLGLDGIQAAWGIHRLVNADMNNAIIRVSAERGLDPREFALVVFGGNGAVHAMHQADELGIGRVLIPKTAPAFSALGLLVADYLVEKVRATVTLANEADPTRLEAIFGELERDAEQELVDAGLPTRRFSHQRFAQCRYPGQTFDIDVPVDQRAIDAKAVEGIATRFHERHEALHTYARSEEGVMIAALRVRSTGLLKSPELQRIRGTAQPARPKAHRQVFFDGGFRRTPIFDGLGFRANQRMQGPAVVEEPFTTIVVPPGWRLKLDRLGTYVGSRG